MMIFEEGAPEERLYVITSGTAEVYKTCPPRPPAAPGDHRGAVRGRRDGPRAPSPGPRRSVEADDEGRGARRGQGPAPSSCWTPTTPAACKLVYEIGRTLAERMAADQRDGRRGRLPPRALLEKPKM